MESNGQKMWEALAEIRLLLARVPRFIKSDVACGIIAAKVKHALAAPPRNCDVGTAEEQTERFLAYCYRMQVVSENLCEQCPLYSQKDCRLAWAQMPYEAKEGGAK